MPEFEIKDASYIKIYRTDFESNIMIPMNEDELDEYRTEYNQMLVKKTISNNNITQEKFITVTIEKKKRKISLTNTAKLITIYEHVILRPEFISPDAGTAKTHHHSHVCHF